VPGHACGRRRGLATDFIRGTKCSTRLRTVPIVGETARSLLEYALAHVDPRRPALAVLYLDLDTFKPINDEHGHDVGDEVLKIVAARLSRAVRGDDTMSRLGGDEFACLPAAFLSWDQLGHLACKLIEVVSAPLTIGALKLAVHASIGIAVYPTDGKTAAELLKSADAAMYRAKRDRTGYAFFDQRPDPRSWLSGSSGPSLSGSR